MLQGQLLARKCICRPLSSQHKAEQDVIPSQRGGCAGCNWPYRASMVGHLSHSCMLADGHDIMRWVGHWSCLQTIEIVHSRAANADLPEFEFYRASCVAQLARIISWLPRESDHAQGLY